MKANLYKYASYSRIKIEPDIDTHFEIINDYINNFIKVQYIYEIVSCLIATTF